MSEQEPLALERPGQGRKVWRGPRGTDLDAWCREIEAIRKAIEAREAERKRRNFKYTSPAPVQWRLDCLADLAQTLDHNRETL